MKGYSAEDIKVMKDALLISNGEVQETAKWLQKTRLPHHPLGSVIRTMYRVRKGEKN